jgi:hypothetical protein
MKISARLKYLTKLLAVIALFALTACSNTPNTPIPATPVVIPDETIMNKAPKTDNGPPMTIQQAGKLLQLVRIMEGGACKNAQQGAKGLFLLYADKDDINRIKAEQGAKVFAEFEKTITDFSVIALEVTVKKFNFSVATPNSDPVNAQQNLIRQFTPIFQETIASSIINFQKKSTLKIAVQPYAPELVFYNQGCEATKESEENEQTLPGQSI